MSRPAELHGSVANAIVFNEEKGSARNASSAPPPHETLSLRTTFEAMNEPKRHQSPYTLRSRTSRFAHFFRENPGIEASPLSELSTAQISVALNRACHSPTVFNDTLGALSALYAYAMRKGWCTSNPLIPIDRRHVTEKEIHPLMPVDLRRLFAACRPPPTVLERKRTSLGINRESLLVDTSDLVPLVALGASAGIRPTECSRLKWQDISLEESVVTVRRASSKTGGAHHVELHPTLALWLQSCKPPAAQPSDLIIPPPACPHPQNAGSSPPRRLRLRQLMELRRRQSPRRARSLSGNAPAADEEFSGLGKIQYLRCKI